MSWNEFTGCMGDCGHQVQEALNQVGEGAVHVLRAISEGWRALPLDVRAMIIMSARYGGPPILAAALVALGVTAGEALEAICIAAVAVGVGVFMAALLGCSSLL